MILSRLKYRIPDSTIQIREGYFKELLPDEQEAYEGFVVSDFSLNKVYGFKEGDSQKEEEFAFTKPDCIAKQQYLELAERYVRSISQGDLKKVILSRIQEEELTKTPDELFEVLEQEYPNAFVYLIQSPQFGIWIGATPERLIKCTGDEAMMISLAGTKSSTDDSPWRQKEIAEQAYVTDYIEQRLKGLNIDGLTVKGPGQLLAGPVKHLYTEIYFNTPYNIWGLVRELHPTPAVCGIPKKKAMDLIQGTEPHDRLLYTGVIGFVHGASTELFVNLRCAQIIDQKVYLYLGGGLTKDSIPAEEWEETLNKAKTLKKFL